MRIAFDGKDIQPAHIADLWINGHYFHDERSKADELRRYVPMQQMLARQVFVNFIVEATRVIFATGYAVKMALRDEAISQ